MMMSNKKKSSAGSDNKKMVDKEFVRLMLEHHEQAVKMSEDYLKEGNAKDIREIAKNIITGQSEEIKKFKAWLKDN